MNELATTHTTRRPWWSGLSCRVGRYKLWLGGGALFAIGLALGQGSLASAGALTLLLTVLPCTLMMGACMLMMGHGGSGKADGADAGEDTGAQADTHIQNPPVADTSTKPDASTTSARTSASSTATTTTPTTEHDHV